MAKYTFIKAALRRDYAGVRVTDDDGTIYNTGAKVVILPNGKLRAMTEAERERIDGIYRPLYAPRAVYIPTAPETAAETEKQTVNLQGITAELRPYQVQGVKYILARKRCILADEMGLGKTLQAIAAMTASGCKYCLTVCPAAVLENWAREIRRFSPSVSVFILHGENITSDCEKWQQGGGVAVTTYDGAQRLNLRSLCIDFLTVDEAHFAKHPEAARSAAVRAAAQRAEYVLLLTGTAFENRPAEACELLRLLNPDAAYIAQGAIGWNDERYRATLAPYYLRRTRADVLRELPPLTELERWVELSPAERDIYDNAPFTQKRRSGWYSASGSKVAELRKICAEAAERGGKVLVFSFFRSTLAVVTSAVKCFPIIGGEMPSKQRQAVIDRFTDAPSGAVLPCQIVAGGTGLNIQAADTVIFCEPQFKPSLENQAIARAYRMGQNKPVTFYRLLGVNTIDERIKTLTEQKQADFERLADESELEKLLENNI